VGRVLPARLFDALVHHVADDEETDLLSLERVERIAGPSGLDAPGGVARRADCPVAPELLRFAD